MGSRREPTRSATADRRCDWRFLLPDGPRSSLLITGGASPVDTARTGGATDYQYLVDDGWVERLTVTSEPAGSEPVDVALVRPGGDIDQWNHVEATNIVVLQPRALGWRRTRAELAGRGYAVEVYWAYPSLAATRRLIPVDEAAAVDWLLADAGPGWLGRTGRALVGRLAARGLRSPLGGVVTDQVIVATRSPGRRLGGLVDEATPVVLSTSGHDEGSRAVATPVGAEPPVVIKVSPRPRYNHNTEAEIDRVATLRSLCHTNGADHATSVLPTHLERTEIGGLVALVEADAGRWTMAALCHRHPDQRRTLLEQAGRALTEFTLAVSSGVRPWSASDFDRLITDPFTQYRAQVEAGPSLIALIDSLQAWSHRFEGRPLRWAERHYDLGPWNIMVDPATRGEGFTFVDWELAPPRLDAGPGPAGADHLYLAKYWLHIALDTDSLEDEAQAFDFLDDPGSPDLATTARFLDEAFDALGTDPALAPIIGVHLWLESALYVLHRRRHHGVDPGSAAHYLEALATHADKLFSRWDPTIG